MKAAFHSKNGSPEVLSIKEVEKMENVIITMDDKI